MSSAAANTNERLTVEDIEQVIGSDDDTQVMPGDTSETQTYPVSPVMSVTGDATSTHEAPIELPDTPVLPRVDPLNFIEKVPYCRDAESGQSQSECSKPLVHDS